MVGAVWLLIKVIVQDTTADANIKTMKVNVDELLKRVSTEMDQVVADIQKTLMIFKKQRRLFLI
jgi:hypothetical protein